MDRRLQDVPRPPHDVTIDNRFLLCGRKMWPCACHHLQRRRVVNFVALILLHSIAAHFSRVSPCFFRGDHTRWHDDQNLMSVLAFVNLGQTSVMMEREGERESARASERASKREREKDLTHTHTHTHTLHSIVFVNRSGMTCWWRRWAGRRTETIK